MKKILLCILAAIFLIPTIAGERKLPAFTTKKINKSIAQIWPGRNIIWHEVTNRIITDSTRIYELNENKLTIGYLYVSEAPTRYATFDYMLITDTVPAIKEVSVLRYTESHGGEITNRRWLKQFIGCTPEKNIHYGRTVDAVTGATISANSLTLAVKQALQKLQKAKIYQ